MLPGVFISPGLLQLYLGGSSGSGPSAYTGVIQSLTVCVVAPLLVGQVWRCFLPPFLVAGGIGSWVAVGRELQLALLRGKALQAVVPKGGRLCERLFSSHTFCPVCERQVGR